jgi:hypothetical protein
LCPCSEETKQGQNKSIGVGQKISEEVFKMGFKRRKELRG